MPEVESHERACGAAAITTEAGRTVLSLSGEHDASTVPALTEQLARLAGDDADVVIDLSDVVFLDASTIGAIVHAQTWLRAASREMTVRSPSSIASYVLELCHLSGLIDTAQDEPAHLSGALASWIGVPTRGALSVDRVDVGRLTDLPVDAPSEASTLLPADAPASDAEPADVPRKLLHGGG